MKRIKIIVALIAMISMTAMADSAFAQRRDNKIRKEVRHHNKSYNARHNRHGAHQISHHKVRHFGKDKFDRHHRQHRMMAMNHKMHHRHGNRHRR